MSSMYIGMDHVLLNLDRTQQQFQNTVTQLSSGLRINSAADDPSGNAIATNLQSKTLGLQQAAQNVQNANNALNVAMGALNSVQSILERMNTLIVESNSDINSAQDLQDIQSEISQLLQEINTIGEKTNFNGQNLLDGAFDTSSGTNPSITEIASTTGGTNQVANYDDSVIPTPGPLVTGASIPPDLSGFGGNESVIMTFTVIGYSANAIDPDSDTDVGPGDYVEFDAYSLGGALFGAAPLYQDISAVPLGAGQLTSQYDAPSSAYFLLNQFVLSNLTAADVGASVSYFATSGTSAATGSALTVNDGGDEGTTVGISLPTINTNVLGLSGITVELPQIVNFQNIVQGTSASNQQAASYAETAVGNALTKITTAQAQIGAQVVSLNIDDGNDNTAIVNYQQSSSDITDLNVGQATTQYTQEQILVSVGTSVLAQMQSNEKVNTALLIQALVA